MIAQPPAQPVFGPNARVAQVKGGAAVRIGLVQLAVADGRQQHGHEREDRHGGRLQGDGADDEDQRGGDAVGGRDRRGRDDRGGNEPERPGLEALVYLLFQ
jgi:hypothetical protein